MQSSDRFPHRWQGVLPLHFILRRLHSLLPPHSAGIPYVSAVEESIYHAIEMYLLRFVRG
jgi:hypothetical protein